MSGEIYEQSSRQCRSSPKGRFLVGMEGSLPPPDKIQVPAVDKQTSTLPDDENRILAMDRIDQQQAGPNDAQVPEQNGDNTFSGPFTCDPLNEESCRKQCLGRET